MSQPELLPCPFCGGPAVMEEVEAVLGVRKSAGCKTEGCQGYQSSVTFATHREAAEAWNKRAGMGEKETLAMLKRLERAADLWAQTDVPDPIIARRHGVPAGRVELYKHVMRVSFLIGALAAIGLVDPDGADVPIEWLKRNKIPDPADLQKKNRN